MDAESIWLQLQQERARVAELEGRIEALGRALAGATSLLADVTAEWARALEVSKRAVADLAEARSRLATLLGDNGDDGRREALAG